MVSAEIVGDIGLMSDTLTEIGRTGVFHPDEIGNFYSDTSSFTYAKGENPYTPAINTLRRICPDCVKGGEYGEMTDDDAFAFVDELEKKFDTLSERRQRADESIREKKEKAGHIKYFFGAGVDLSDLTSCKYTHIRFGSLSENSAAVLSELCMKNGEMIFIPTITENGTQYGICCCHTDYADEADRILSGLYFRSVSPISEEGVAEDIYKSLTEGVKAEEELLSELDDRIAQMRSEQLDNCRGVYSYLNRHKESYALRNHAVLYKDKFIICGWIPKDSQKDFCASVESIDGIECKIQSEGGGNGVLPPTKLKNSALVRPYEFYVGMYGLPSYGELDPTPFVAVTYTVLFGIMFGDVGQGLVLSLIGWLMYKIGGMALGKILVPCGFCSALFGLVYGSVFGFEHLLDPMYRAMGFAEKPVEVMHPTTTQMIIYGAVGIGVCLVISSMAVNIISCIKKKDAVTALFSGNGLCGLIFYTALVAGLVCQMLLGIPVMSGAYTVCLIVVPLVLMFLKEHIDHCIKHRKLCMPESVSDYAMQNFFELFEAALGYVTNTMSFLRVGAFVLVHAGMMMVVFTLAEMSSGIGYILILVLGNGLVIALEGLLVGIQVLRREFYEMFSRFFDGDGRAYEPVGNR